MLNALKISLSPSLIVDGWVKCFFAFILRVKCVKMCLARFSKLWIEPSGRLMNHYWANPFNMKKNAMHSSWSAALTTNILT